MSFLKNVPMGVTDATMGDSMLFTTFMEMLTNARGQDDTMMMHEVSLNIVFYMFNYLIFLIILYYFMFVECMQSLKSFQPL